MNCVICGTQMIQEPYEGVIIDRCPQCGGAWVDWGELGPIVQRRQVKFGMDKRVEQLAQAQEDQAPEQARQCPQCGKQMRRFNYAVTSGVFLDRCPDKHGIWLDPGELEQVQVVMEEFDREYSMAGPQEGPPVPGAKMCPRCDIPLHEMTYEGVVLDRCEKCGGTWCDEQELAEVVRIQHEQFSEDDFAEIRAEEEAAAVTTEEKIPDQYPCLVCGRMMNRMNYQYTSGIIIDRCPVGHGVWLDSSELGKVQVFSERWEAAGHEVAAKYQKALTQANAESERRMAEGIKEIKVSRLGVVNRFFQDLARRGVL